MYNHYITTMDHTKTIRNAQVTKLAEHLALNAENLTYLQDKSLITFVGLCGSGKSTIINLILKNKLVL